MKVGHPVPRTSDNNRCFSASQVQGFSLIELMVAMLISLILLAGIYSVYAAHTRSYTTQNVSADVQQSVRAAIDYMAEDIMMAGFNPLHVPGEAFEHAAENFIQFTFDSDMDGTLEQVNYTLSGSQLLLNGVPLVSNVKGLTFTYWMTNAGTNDSIVSIDTTLVPPEVAAVNRSKIRSVDVSMTVEEPAGRAGMVERTYATRIRCRNLSID